MYYRAVARVICGPVPGDKFKRTMRVDVLRGPLVEDRQRAESLREAMRVNGREEKVVQEIEYLEKAG